MNTLFDRPQFSSLCLQICPFSVKILTIGDKKLFFYSNIILPFSPLITHSLCILYSDSYRTLPNWPISDRSFCTMFRQKKGYPSTDCSYLSQDQRHWLLKIVCKQMFLVIVCGTTSLWDCSCLTFPLNTFLSLSLSFSSSSRNNL